MIYHLYFQQSPFFFFFFFLVSFKIFSNFSRVDPSQFLRCKSRRKSLFTLCRVKEEMIKLTRRRSLVPENRPKLSAKEYCDLPSGFYFPNRVYRAYKLVGITSTLALSYPILSPIRVSEYIFNWLYIESPLSLFFLEGGRGDEGTWRKERDTIFLQPSLLPLVIKINEASINERGGSDSDSTDFQPIEIFRRRSDR